MAQVKFYGVADQLRPITRELSEIVHACLMEALALPAEKRFHRFFPLEPEHFIYPADRTDRYTIIEISMFAGRSVEAKKALIRLLVERLQAGLGIAPQDVEIAISETPRHNWGIRGLPGDELSLNYQVGI